MNLTDKINLLRQEIRRIKYENELCQIFSFTLIFGVFIFIVISI